jgi:queuosine precursor transporter
VLFTPVTYWVVARLKHAEGVDVYDTHTRFTPFSLREDGEIRRPA